MQIKDFYYILGVKIDATPDEIKVAYRKLTIKFHPDKNDSDKFFEERFKEIQEAYETLSNESRRSKYDESLRPNHQGSNETTSTTKASDPYGILSNMIVVEGGTFIMGCTNEQGTDCKNDEKPAHRVTLESFTISKYQVTQAQWQAVMGKNPSHFRGCAQCPVENVSWWDIKEFVHQLFITTGINYRLPTEAEWEYAARGGNKSKGYKYAGSNDLDAVAWHFGNSGRKTHPVGQKQANELGLYDMSGNVYELCKHGYDKYKEGPDNNPQGPYTPAGAMRVVRGGSWWWALFNSTNSYRVSYRGLSYDSYRTQGFRLVISSFQNLGEDYGSFM